MVIDGNNGRQTDLLEHKDYKVQTNQLLQLSFTQSFLCPLGLYTPELVGLSTSRFFIAKST